MTGGQDVTGLMDVPAMTRALEAEGVAQDRRLRRGPEAATAAGRGGPPGREVLGRDRLPEVQEELRRVPGVTVIIYDQRCAAEARRLRQRGLLPEPPRRVVINEAVCEGCGDCSAKSNCLSVLPHADRVRREAADPRPVLQPRLHLPGRRLPLVRDDHPASGAAGHADAPHALRPRAPPLRPPPATLPRRAAGPAGAVG